LENGAGLVKIFNRKASKRMSIPPGGLVSEAFLDNTKSSWFLSKMNDPDIIFWQMIPTLKILSINFQGTFAACF